MAIVSEKYNVVIYTSKGEVHYVIYNIEKVNELIERHKDDYQGMKVFREQEQSKVLKLGGMYDNNK